MKTINQRQSIMKPAYGLTKAQRKQYRSSLHSTYPNVDLSYDPNLSVNSVSINFFNKSES